jgi:FkbM family methyltransferase
MRAVYPATLALMLLGGRPLKMWAAEIAEPRNWQAVARMARRTTRPMENTRRYLLASGDYPYSPQVRTPLGTVAVKLHGHDDMWTFNEVFMREDYACPPDARTVVDFGSNIGVSALYFLTRNRDLRCWLFEPVPTNVARLRENLSAYDDRYTLSETAVGLETGTATFGVEPTGRYGGVGVPTGQTIEVPCLDANAAIAAVLERVDHIDVLKVDIEGLEVDVVGALEPEHLRRISTIYFEWRDDVQLHPELFSSSHRNETYRLRRLV